MVQMDCGYMKKRRENPEREIQLEYLCLQAIKKSTQIFPFYQLVLSRIVNSVWGSGDLLNER